MGYPLVFSPPAEDFSEMSLVQVLKNSENAPPMLFLRILGNGIHVICLQLKNIRTYKKQMFS